jgi:hypothetical protein
MEAIQALWLSLNLGQKIGIAGLVAGALLGLWVNRAAIVSKLPAWLNPNPKPPVADHGDRAAQLARLSADFDWFIHENCPEGAELIKQAVPHAMHVHPPAASAGLATVTVSVPAPLSPPVA